MKWLGLLGLETSFAKRRMHLGYRLAETHAPLAGHAARTPPARPRVSLRHHPAAQPDAALAHVTDATDTAVPETGSTAGSSGGGPILGHLLPSDRRGDMTGFVSFVSSGPGDPELADGQGRASRLAAAEVVLFDDLSSGPILGHAAASRSDRGRQKGRAALAQARSRQPPAGRSRFGSGKRWCG